MRVQFGSIGAAAAMGLLAFSATGAQAANVTSNAIFGSGNANGSFTIGTGTYGTAPSTVELGLRGKLRFDENNLPQNKFNYDGVDTYTFNAGTPPTGFGFAAGSPSTAIWNFEWSIGTDRDGGANPVFGETTLDQFTYELRLDGDRSAGTQFLTFDPMVFDALALNSIGTAATLQSQGEETSDAGTYATLLNEKSLAQNSWNYEFFNLPGTPLEFFDASLPGTYRIELEAFSLNGDSVASTAINIRVVPIPGAAPLMLSAIAGFAWLRRRRNA